MKCIILAGGRGERLGELTENIPKPMIEIKEDDRILERLIEHLKKFNIFDIVLCVGYKSEKIMEHFGDGKLFGVNIQYCVEKELLGTGGALKLAEGMAGDEFLVIYGDIATDMDIGNLISMHEMHTDNIDAIGTIVVHPSGHPRDSDLVEVDKSNIVKRLFRAEKGIYDKYISNAGIYCFNKGIFSYIKEGKSSLDKDVLPEVLKHETVCAYFTKERVRDIGTVDRLYIEQLREALDGIRSDDVQMLTNILCDAKMRNSRIFVMGNGDSATNSLHAAADMSKSCGLKIQSLCENVPLITAWANDANYDYIFMNQLCMLMDADDVVIGISTSGNSKNVCNAIGYAMSRGKTISLTAGDGGELAKMSDLDIRAKTNSVEIAEDVHFVIFHLVKTKLLEMMK